MKPHRAMARRLASPPCRTLNSSAPHARHALYAPDVPSAPPHPAPAPLAIRARFPALLARLALPCVAAWLAMALLAGCAAPAGLREARDFAEQAPKLGGYAEMSKRFRDTYAREQAYLSPEAGQRERAADVHRRAAYPDLVAIHAAVLLYMQALGTLAGGERFDLKDGIKALAAPIKAWPDTGLTDRHVNAYSGLAQVLARAVTGPYQQRAVQAMVRDGDSQLQALLQAMQDVLRYYDKSSDNESRIVLGMLDVETAFAGTPQERLLAALAKAHRAEKVSEYRLIGLRHTLAAKHVADIAAAHRALVRRMAETDAAGGK